MVGSIVVKCSPSSPPICLKTLALFCETRLKPISFNVHVHSDVLCDNVRRKKLLDFFPKLSNELSNEKCYQICFIWKNSNSACKLF